VVVVPAGTIVSTQSGISFATLRTVDVPSAVQSFTGTTNGQAPASIQAVVPGAGSNVAAGTITIVDGRLAGVILVTNGSRLIGGSDRTVVALTDQDETTAIGLAQRQLAAREKAWINQKYAQSP